MPRSTQPDTAPRRTRTPRRLPTLPDGAIVGGAERWAWVRELMADRAVTYATRLVGVAVAMHINDRTGWTWTSVPALASEVSMHQWSVRRCLDTLADQQPTRRPYLHRQTSAKGGYTYTCLLAEHAAQTSRPGALGNGEPRAQERKVTPKVSELAEDVDTFRQVDETSRIPSTNLAHSEHEPRAWERTVPSVPLSTGGTNAEPSNGHNAEAASDADAPSASADDLDHAGREWLAAFQAWDPSSGEPMPQPPTREGAAS